MLRMVDLSIVVLPEGHIFHIQSWAKVVQIRPQAADGNKGKGKAELSIRQVHKNAHC